MTGWRLFVVCWAVMILGIVMVAVGGRLTGRGESINATADVLHALALTNHNGVTLGCWVIVGEPVHYGSWLDGTTEDGRTMSLRLPKDAVALVTTDPDVIDRCRGQ